ncbi:hypothetical protein UFOVP58_57 [uncultured Caudovirales phage]|uniref:Uncharacterized protein n=1 Tax=uncultured Caudovirales phage TaxID=2100421 RepID=A0A6J5KT14_9CAUD|nr:hypothetical protein UFOVP58_57 [uncultured Caudovirales phage]
MALWGNKDSKSATGTISIVGSTGVVTGVSTLFTTEAKLGNTIRVSGEDYQIVSITSDTVAKVRSGIVGTAMTDRSGVSYTLSEKPASARMSSAGDLGSSNVFGVDNAEVAAGGDNVVSVAIANAGTRYLEVPGVTVAAPAAITVATTAVTIVADTITVTNHRYLTGTKLTYSAAAGTVLGGLSDATAYYVIRVDADTFKLASSLAYAQAGTAIDLSGTGNSSQTFTGDTATVGTATIAGGAVTGIAVTNTGTAYLSAPVITVNKPRRIIPTSGVDINLEQFSYTAHGLVAGDSVKYFHGGGAAVTGLTNDTGYFISALGLATGTFRLAASAGAVPARTALSTVAISGTAGQFTCVGGTLAVGDQVVIAGALGTGTITGYTTPKIYEVSAVTGTSPSVTGFTLTNEDTTAIVTTAGTVGTATFTPYTIVMLSGTGNAAQYFELQATADQATAVSALGDGATVNATHAGWVKRTVGTGGRAGRIQTEVLVAMGSMTGDQADDIQYPDA